MKSSMDASSNSSPPMPRRRGAAHPVVQHQDARTEETREETPVLLRLPDLHPSEAIDAAVRRIEKQATKKPSTPPAENKKSRSEIRVTSERPPVPPVIKSSATANWNNRIIVTTFVMTLLASAFMVIQRAARDRGDDSQSGAPVSAQQDFEPIPSHRINRQSFQADSRSGDSGELKRKQGRKGATTTTARIGSHSSSESNYDAAPVSYESELHQSQAEQSRNRSSQIDTRNMYDLSIPSHTNDSQDVEQPRTLRLRGQ